MPAFNVSYKALAHARASAWANLQTEAGAACSSQRMPAFNVAKIVTEPLAVASGCQHSTCHTKPLLTRGLLLGCGLLLGRGQSIPVFWRRQNQAEARP